MKYRTREEAEKAKERDPIVLYESVLKERGWIDEAAIDEMHAKIKVEVDEAIRFAEESPEPGPDMLYQDITVAPYIPQE